MSKLTQCVKCDHDRRNCGHFILENDTDCPHYMRGGAYQEKDETTTNVKTIIHWAFLYIFFSIYVYIRWFDDARVFFVFAIPLVLFIIWAVIVYNTKSRKQRQEVKEKVSKAIYRTAIDSMKLLEEANQSEDFFEDKPPMGDRIEVDFNDLIQNPTDHRSGDGSLICSPKMRIEKW